MGWYVHINVVFACDDNEPVAALAAKHLPLLSEADREAVWFLEDLTERKGKNPGPKGGLSTWGMVDNYTHADRFCESLKPFFEEMLSGEVGGICTFEHILVFEEPEQSESATAYELMLGGKDSDEQRELLVKKHDNLPFAWMQF